MEVVDKDRMEAAEVAYAAEDNLSSQSDARLAEEDTGIGQDEEGSKTLDRSDMCAQSVGSVWALAPPDRTSFPQRMTSAWASSCGLRRLVGTGRE